MADKLHELDWTRILWHWLSDTYPNAGLRIGRERRLWDSTRVDILTDDLAIEVDWAYKYAEGIGQSLLYRVRTNRKPGVCLLVKDFKKETIFVSRCEAVCTAYSIDLWIVDTSKYRLIIGADVYDLRPFGI